MATRSRLRGRAKGACADARYRTHDWQEYKMSHLDQGHYGRVAQCLL